MNILKILESSNLFKLAFSERFEGALTTKDTQWDDAKVTQIISYSGHCMYSYLLARRYLYITQIATTMQFDQKRKCINERH